MADIDTRMVRQVLLDQRHSRMKGGIYHLNQIEMAYNSNHIEGSQLTEEQTRRIFETQTIDGQTSVDDIVETVNHFAMFGYMLDHLEDPLDAGKVKTYHRLLKQGTSDADKPWFALGDWKRLANEVGGKSTTPPDRVDSAMSELLARPSPTTVEDIADWHSAFETIHPFQDGNGRVGRIIMFEQCLNRSVAPFIVLDSHKDYYYRGLANYASEHGWLVDTFKAFQDAYAARYAGMIPSSR